MKQAILVLNPRSGKSSRPSSSLDWLVRSFFDRGIDVWPVLIEEGVESNLEQTLRQEDFDLVVASGGDGTLNLVANVLLRNGSDLPMGIIPSGTSNDLAACLNLPADLGECLDVIAAGRTTPLDAGLINGQDYFLTTCAGGLFVNASFTASPKFKQYVGPLAYYLKAASEAVSINTFDLRLTTEDGGFEDEAVLFLVSNGRTAAGFRNLISGADFSDGVMDILIVKKCGYPELGSLLYQAFRGQGIGGPRVVTMKASFCMAECSPEVLISVDGEKGGGMPLGIEMVPSALRVLVGE
ncbi:MAG: YegS/Rv2252/BmrU family lipid kinase [Firmicutes bacterium]|nr:YegS/Rv2252/BmrU family lipid kinase [Bacillota bacterium]